MSNFTLTSANIFYGDSRYPVEPANMERWLPQTMPEQPSTEDVRAVEDGMFRLCGHRRDCGYGITARAVAQQFNLPECMTFFADGWTVQYTRRVQRQ